jgi:V/A-type H+-transporting ATPase subunit K
VSGNNAGWAFLAAALSISVSVLGAGIALSKIGAAAMAALAEKPEIMGSAIVFAGLAEGLSIWGLIVAVLILLKV